LRGVVHRAALLGSAVPIPGAEAVRPAAPTLEVIHDCHGS